MDEQEPKPKAQVDRISEWIGIVFGWLLLGLVVLGLLWTNLWMLRGCVNLVFGR